MAPVTRKLSGGFASSSTRSLESLEREIESRMQRAIGFEEDPFNPTRMDVFTDDFDRPSGGPRQTMPWMDTRKDANDYQAKHDDFSPSAESRYKTAQDLRKEAEQMFSKKNLAEAGRPEDQDWYDEIDESMMNYQREIKKPQDQFPGSRMEEKKMAGKLGPESFNKMVEKKLASGYLPVISFNHKGHTVKILKWSGTLKGEYYTAQVDGSNDIIPMKFSSSNEAKKAAIESIDDVSMSKRLEGEQSGGIHIDIDSHKGEKDLAQVDEGKWSEAKKAAHKSYPSLGESDEKFWKIVQTIYANMGGK